MVAIIVHGGAGVLRGSHNLERYRVFLGISAEKGYAILKSGGSALDGVMTAVYEMEECGEFNAGSGCVLTLDGYAELDAGVMDGQTLSTGAVGCVREVRHPVLGARFVMEKTDHVLLVGDGAQRFLEANGILRDSSLITTEKLEKLQRLKREWFDGKSGRLQKNRSWYRRMHGTVGAVAVDSQGRVAAAVSTGGYWLKMSGRVGDSAVAGAGFYANHTGGAVATGTGEIAIKEGLARKTVEALEAGLSPEEASKRSIENVSRKYGEGTMGLIVLDSKGEIGYAYNTQGMGRAWIQSGRDSPFVGVFPEDNPRM